MDYKEEYQKALERAKKGLPIDEVFPELKESEDERIRKFLVELVSNDKANNYNGLYKDRGVRFDDVLAYLEKQKDINCLACDQHLKGYIAGRKVTEEEKQKEQKPAEWSEEEKQKLNRIYAILGQAADTHAFSTTCRLIGDKEAVELQDFLRSIAKPESGAWSEEDEKCIKDIINCLEYLEREDTERQYNGDRNVKPERYEGMIAKLKSLRPSWNPSEEQMEALTRATNRCVGVDDAKILVKLLEQLEKL